ncbi:uncharacterized protein (DUF2147 family) [Breoghania corrubedonensis]|uniref:Uncharacterized protein (DUF2147 family) n=1 Tax=Breoghania corrubedonensis TaxID=665038 RepID=A0A2T5VCF1_9HYPH|nr:DUF2147 domain-containing protein [Breoghania corrubedonensis]PTW61443.1 uncharacterized protein (DUF2147 family) [Breoghania corrubedonensis]
MRKAIKVLSVATGIAIAGALTMGAAAAADAEGTWARPSGSSQIRIAPCGSALCGKLVWLRDKGKKDENNPDTSKRDRSLLGVLTVYGMKPAGENEWRGKVYNAEDGKTYTGKMELITPSKLKLSGCVLGGLICKGETWRRVK